MHDEPLAVLILPDYGPAEVAHLNLTGLGVHFVSHRSRAPHQITLGMDGGIIVYRALCALVTGKHALYTVFVFVPTGVLQRGDIEERMRAAGVVLGYVGGIESGPAVPDFLRISSIGN